MLSQPDPTQEGAPAASTDAAPLVLYSRVLALIGAPITLILVATWLSAADRGYYFVAINLQALAFLVETGIGLTVLHFASNEYAQLTWDRPGLLLGAEDRIQRLGQLLRGANRSYGRLGAVAALGAAAFGLVVGAFDVSATPASTIAWLVLAVAIGQYVACVPRLMVLEGCGQLPQVQRMRVTQAGADLATLWLTIPWAGGVPAVAAMSMVHLLIATTWMQRRYRSLWHQLRIPADPPSATGFNWNRHVWPVQWRTGLTSLAGYATHQSLTPLVLVGAGAAAAGRFGLSLAIATAPYTLGLGWLQGRQPLYGSYLGARDLVSFQRVSRATGREALLLWLVASVLAVTLVFGLDHASQAIASKLLGTTAVAALCLAGGAQLLVQLSATQLRAQRVERNLVPIGAGALATLALCSVMLALSGVEAVAVGYAVATAAVTLPLSRLALRRHSLGVG